MYVVCMDRLMANFAGTCTSDNKGLLLLLLTKYFFAPLYIWFFHFFYDSLAILSASSLP